MARKPLEGTVASNVLKYGVGGINIDGCRVATDDDLSANYNSVRKSDDEMGERGYKMGFRQGKDSIANATESTKLGRFPANFIHDGSEEVVKLFPNTVPTKPHGGDGKKLDTQDMGWGFKRMPSTLQDNGGSASRFFYTAKASQTERNWGLSQFEEKYTASAEFRPNHMEKALDGESGNPYGRWQPKKNIHPTVKPIDLMRYLVRLVTPKNGICLDPYMGSGTTAIACKSEKINYVGCELDEEYIKIAEARIKAEVVVYDIFDFGA
jgi:site-specific DNA-methyltransferase (adenine-specific)